PLVVEAGVELIAPSGLTLPGLDLPTSGWNPNGATPIDLTVRAASDINVSGTISDGFGSDPTQPTLLQGASSSIRLVSGADLHSANPFAATAATGTLTIGPNAVVRTGTGDINLVAGQNIVIADEHSGAYTAGTPAIDGILVPIVNELMSF